MTAIQIALPTRADQSLPLDVPDALRKQHLRREPSPAIDASKHRLVTVSRRVKPIEVSIDRAQALQRRVLKARLLLSLSALLRGRKMVMH
ncbi:hypothetical protein EAH78_20245 [Pseudomonas arsenicoxydans]|uniref:Uncharacterized protein n=1 Tax=Pseudomonas arsenicoxydans TaxID=702115 RepID=A0A502HMH6_9PSED|nr:hypothetical protein EAH78_20245 [Pseudomonas arsenicoxydans]